MGKKVWFITGCSSGLGQQFVPAILARGDLVIATARNLVTLESLQHSTGVHTIQLDVTASQGVLDQKVEEALRIFGGIDVLVNNAGFVVPGVWEEVNHEDAARQFATNFFGALNLTRSLLPHFRARKSGTLIFISSIAAWLGVAGGGLYTSSKCALEGAVECLHMETAHLGIDTHLMILGQFRTDILNQKRRMPRPKPGIREYDAITEKVSNRQSQTDGKQPGSAQLAVERIIDIVRREGAMTGVQRLPLRIPLGSDAVKIVRAKCNEMLSHMSQFEQFAQSTDYYNSSEVPGYL